MQAYHLDILRNDITRHDMKLKIQQKKNVRDIRSDKFSFFSFSLGGGVTKFLNQMLREHEGGDTHSFLGERNHMPAWPLDVQTLPTAKEH